MKITLNNTVHRQYRHRYDGMQGGCKANGGGKQERGKYWLSARIPVREENKEEGLEVQSC